jgi:hypothetical protein
MKSELFGTMFKPNARWKCSVCKSSNVNRLVAPLRAEEPVACRRCHRITRLNLDLNEVPRQWGGKKE